MAAMKRFLGYTVSVARFYVGLWHKLYVTNKMAVRGSWAGEMPTGVCILQSGSTPTQYCKCKPPKIFTIKGKK